MDEFIWVPDWNAQESTKANIYRAQFGDGYVQRQAKGMNPLNIRWELTFNPRDDDTIEAVIAFLKARFGVTAFTWTPPGEDQAKWTCSDWRRTKAGFDVGGLAMTFDMVYEP